MEQLSGTDLKNLIKDHKNIIQAVKRLDFPIDYNKVTNESLNIYIREMEFVEPS